MKCLQCKEEIVPCTTEPHCGTGFGYMHAESMSHWCNTGDILVIKAATPPKREREKFVNAQSRLRQVRQDSRDIGGVRGGAKAVSPLKSGKGSRRRAVHDPNGDQLSA